jgi:hypothetical protein
VEIALVSTCTLRFYGCDGISEKRLKRKAQTSVATRHLLKRQKRSAPANPPKALLTQLSQGVRLSLQHPNRAFAGAFWPERSSRSESILIDYTSPGQNSFPV